MLRRRFLLAEPAVMLSVGLVACSSAREEKTGPTRSSQPAAVDEVAQSSVDTEAEGAVVPVNLRDPVGTGVFEFGPAETVDFAYTFDKATSFDLTCIPHEALGMVGKIVVQ